MTPLQFLDVMRPGGPWVLTAIVPDKGTTTTTFRSDQYDLLERWLAAKNGVENIYFQVADTGPRNITKKTTKADILSSRWLWADIDPSPRLPRETILNRLQTCRLRPSVVVDSGGGYQAFWRIALCDDLDDLEAVNRWLAHKLDADGCGNRDRIMRLPGTTNLPNKKKRAAGRAATQACVMWAEDTAYDLADFGRVRMNLTRSTSAISDWTGPTDALFLAEALPPWSVAMLNDPGSHCDDRSRHMIAFIGGALRGGASRELVAWCCLNPQFAVSAHALDQKDPARAVARAFAYVEAGNECA